MADVRFRNLKKPMSIRDNEPVKVTQMGHIVEVIHTACESDTLSRYVKIDKERYFVLDRDTGEIIDEREYNINENRGQNTEGLKRTMKNIRDLINNNFCGANNELFITLTYRLNEDGTPQNDVEKASKDFDRFIKRFRRKYPDLEYIAVLEPQANTAWHWHILARFDKWTDKFLHIKIDNNSIMEPLWGHGYTKVKAIRQN